LSFVIRDGDSENLVGKARFFPIVARISRVIILHPRRPPDGIGTANEGNGEELFLRFLCCLLFKIALKKGSREVRGMMGRGIIGKTPSSIPPRIDRSAASRNGIRNCPQIDAD
jgi:hypothetical protein